MRRERQNKPKSALTLFRSLAALLMALGPPLFLIFHLDAHGPVWVLIAAVTVIIGAAGFAEYTGINGTWSTLSLPARCFRILWVSLCILAVLAVALQLNVARRSLAEAWFELVREGRAFGFFSFFAAQICALFCSFAALLALKKSFTSGLSAFAGILLLIYGILYARGSAALGSIVFLSIAALIATTPFTQDGPASFRVFLLRLKGRMQSTLLPFVAAAVLTLPFMFVPGFANDGALLYLADFSPLVLRFFPSLPLLLDVPGYGYSVGASSFSPSVYLSNAVLFSVQADSLRTYYLSTSRYDEWNGRSWTERDSAGREIPVFMSDEKSELPENGRIQLLLEAELFDRIPLPAAAAWVRLYGSPPSLLHADSNRSLRFEGTAFRGLRAEIMLDSGLRPVFNGSMPQILEGEGPVEPEDDAALFLDPGPDPGGRIAALSQQLGSADNPEALKRAIIQYFLSGYSYSLKTPAYGSENPISEFLFEHRTGYCLHYAGAAVLLARHAGLPARLVEGYIVYTDRSGRGFIRGVDSHAWAEFWINGRWELVEATAPFASEDPFLFAEHGDSDSLRQLRAIFGALESDTQEKPETGSFRWPALLVSIFLLVLCGIIVLYLCRPRYLGDPYAELKRQAYRRVRKGRRKGVEGPEVQGWIGWAEELGALCSSEDEKKKVHKLALAMLEAAFNPDIPPEAHSFKTDRF